MTMVIMGLWHGSNLTFAVWGAYHGILLVFHKMTSAAKIKVLKPIGVIFTFALVNLGWIFFRSENIEAAFGIIGSVFSCSLFSGIQYQPGMFLGAILIFALFLCEAADAKWNIGARVINAHPAVAGLVYAALFYVFVFFSARETAKFIYFQF
jgi:D-alanyl-lipoteichoic acid acyltransferase DltB (MBOAT superfamily)